jgi:hypothetical protein
MPATATKATLIVTKDELSELAEWERKYASAKDKLSDAEKELKFQRQRLAEKVLGVATADELKQLAPKQIEQRMQKRLEAGDWKPERGAPEFSFVLTNKGRYPAWSKLYAEELGETAAAGVTANTDYQHSYRVEVVPA